MGFENVNIDRKPLLKKSRFNFSHRTETTLDWGIMTPIHCQRLAVGDSFNNISFSAVSRLTTLNAPTLGDIRLRTYWQFVPTTDVYKGFNNFLAQLPRLNSGSSTTTPIKLPCVSSSFLMYVLSGIHYSRVVSYFKDPSSNTWILNDTVPTMDTWAHVFKGLKTNMPLSYQPVNEFGFCGDYAMYNHEYFEPKTSDFRVMYTEPNGNHGTFYGKYTRRGLNLLTALITCGYKPSFTSDKALDATPLLAMYKAYFDVMSPQYKNFEDTYCYRLIRYYDLNGVNSNNVATLQNYSDSSGHGFSDELRTLWKFFFMQLSDMIYYADNDYISSHINGNFTDGSLQNYSDLYELNNLNVNRSGGNVLRKDQYLNLLNPSVTTNFTTSMGGETLAIFDQCTDEWIKRAYYYANKKSALGMALKSVMMARGLTNFVEDTDSRRIGNTNDVIKINEIINTADTSSMSLGDYAGQSSNNHGSGNFDFKTNEIGFVFGFATIVPDGSRFVNGFDSTLLKTSPYDYYSGLFDGLSYEYSPRAIVGKDSALQIESHDDINLSFGLIPRHTDYKISRDLCTGCFGIRSMREHLSPYHMARLAYENEGTYDNYTYDSATHTFEDSASLQINETLPSADNGFYRRVDRNTVTGFYDRIFVENDGYETDHFERRIGYYQSFPTPDIMCQLKINHFADMRMLPIEDSWQTTCDEEDNGKKVSVSKA